MVIDLSPLVALAFAALGAIFALPVMVGLALAGIWWPSLFAWLWLPPAVGFVIGAILGGYAK